MTAGEEEPDGGRGPSGEAVVELAKRRGLFFPSNDVYGGTAGFYTWGPNGAAIKRHVEDAWRERFTVREDNLEIDAPTVMPEAVFEASGHLDGFNDMLVECAECGESHRADHLLEDATDIEDAESLPVEEVEELLRQHDVDCPTCGASLAGEPVEAFNLMFATAIGPGNGAPAYLRPETAQGIFVEFPRLAEYARGQLPFGVTQIGPAYRNEISPRRSVIRVREFTQAELELFIDPDTDRPNLEPIAERILPLYPAAAQTDPDGDVVEMTVAEAVGSGPIEDEWIAYYLGISVAWFERIGLDMDRFRFRQHLAGERAHYASDCWDAEAELDGAWIELAGFADRGAYDLSKHADHSGEDFTVFRPFEEPVRVERATVEPDMSALGPRFGAEATAVAEALERLAERDPDAFEDDPVIVEVAGERHELPLDDVGFTREEVTEAGEHLVPHVVEPSFGIGRIVYAVIDHSFDRDRVDAGTRTVLRLPPRVAPHTVGVFPLMDRDGLAERARALARALRDRGLEVTYDDSGNIGRRYRRQDEVGTPFCVTVDYETLEGDEETVTVRDRDSTEQIRLPRADLPDLLVALRDGEIDFATLLEEHGAVGRSPQADGGDRPDGST